MTAVRALDPDDVLLLADVAAGCVHRDASGQDWREGGTPHRTSVQELLRQGLAEPAAPGPDGVPPSGPWQPTAEGHLVLGEVAAMLAESGHTLDDMRRHLEQLRRDGVL